MKRSVLLAAAWGGLAAAVAPPARAGLVFRFDYTYDTGGFFKNKDAKAALEKAAQAFAGFTDTLSEIKPGGKNVWQAVFNNPATGGEVAVDNLVVPKNTLVIYAGARDLDGAAVGAGGFGGFRTGTDSAKAFQDTVAARGQAGALKATPTDVGPWGGAVAFDTKTKDGKARDWNFDLKAGPKAGQDDFLYIATHELAHVLGFGTAPSWEAYVKGAGFGLEFAGPASVAANGGVNPDLQPNDDGHWNALLKSPGVDGKGMLSPLMIPEADAPGKRLVMTRLDYAGMKDVGWEVAVRGVPEPSAAALLAAGALGAAGIARRFRTKAVR